MMIQRKLIYMLLGGLLALGLTFGAFAAFAQTEDNATTTPDTATEDDAATTPDTATEDDSTTTTPALPGYGRSGHHGADGTASAALTADDELLANALGITTDELDAAKEAAKTAAIEQAVADGLLTQDEADQLLAGDLGRHSFARSITHMDNYDALLADALGISTDELAAARDEAYTARLAEMVTSGVITQEQADLMQAYENVQGYVDYDALNASVQSYLEEAVAQALADGVITQEQADLMLSELANINVHGLGDFSRHGAGSDFGGRGHGHGSFDGSDGRGSFTPTTPSDTTTETSGA
ncbi:MAG: hypothetical protein KC413_23390 [Anaerolineales bacterium]|nr:hypothetical protein [Anaerolineales bacterium]